MRGCRLGFIHAVFIIELAPARFVWLSIFHGLEVLSVICKLRVIMHELTLGRYDIISLVHTLDSIVVRVDSYRVHL